ncbi:hypothetical protein DFH06DRAFT_1143724 [Mycena polygramma]|nr:hypothetical protein DFH06DRAFT_1143724 [Mycena polygramma]
MPAGRSTWFFLLCFFAALEPAVYPGHRVTRVSKRACAHMECTHNSCSFSFAFWWEPARNYSVALFEPSVRTALDSGMGLTRHRYVVFGSSANWRRSGSATQALSGVWMSDASSVSSGVKPDLCRPGHRARRISGYSDRGRTSGPGRFAGVEGSHSGHGPGTLDTAQEDIWPMYRPGLGVTLAFDGFLVRTSGSLRGLFAVNREKFWRGTGLVIGPPDAFAARIWQLHLFFSAASAACVARHFPEVLGSVFSKTDGTHASAKGKTCVPQFVNWWMLGSFAREEGTPFVHQLFR